MNDNKTEFTYFGGPKHLEKCIMNHINVNGEMIPRSHITRYLGTYLDSTLNLKEHIKKKCKAAVLNLLKIKATRKFLRNKYKSHHCTSHVTPGLCKQHTSWSTQDQHKSNVKSAEYSSKNNTGKK